MPEPSRVRRQLGVELRKLRTLAGVAQRPVAEASGVSQSTVLRVERGEQLLSLPAAKAWLTAVDADEDASERVLALLMAAHNEMYTWADYTLDGLPELQQQARERERASKSVRNFQPTMIPGLLQTADYARAVLQMGHTLDPVAALAARLERQEILHEAGRRFSFLLTEAALRWAPGRDVKHGQADRIVSLSKLDAVEVAVMPAASADLVPWSNFVLHELVDDDAYVTIELFHGQLKLSDPGNVVFYETAWRAAWAVALSGDDAVAAIREMVR